MELKNKYEHDFIYGYEIDESICDGLIDWYESTEEGLHTGKNTAQDTISKFPGQTIGDDGGNRTKKQQELKALLAKGGLSEEEENRYKGKQSTDLSFGAFNSHPAARRYLDEGLTPVIQKYKEKFPKAWTDGLLGFNPPAAMPDGEERLKTGYGSFEWEVGTTMNIQKYKPGEGFFNWHCERSVPTTSSVDRVLVFMTYLNDVPDGGTKFLHQDIVTPAKKGLTIIWPVDWTYTHAGQISQASEKYIVTGWISYLRGVYSDHNEIPYFYLIPPRIETPINPQKEQTSS